MKIRSVREDDFQGIAEIYNYYVQHSVATFDEAPVTVHFVRHKAEVILPDYPYLVLEDPNGRLIGYAYGSSFREKSGYRFTVETTIYFDPAVTHKGYGTVLYTALLAALRAKGYKTAIGVLGLPNEASAKLHEKLGFIKTGHIRNAGRKFEQWVDTGYWCLDLESFQSPR
jgi:L-amino acid N-acyltransferase YncA